MGNARRWRNGALTALVLVGALAPGLAPAQAPGPVLRIGVLTDMSGPFSDQVGRGSVVAAELAAEDFAREPRPFTVTVLAADHQNKPDIGLALARRWLDVEGVAAIVDLPHSGVALGVAELMRSRDRVALASSAMTSDLTGRACAPTTVQWVSDTWAQGTATAEALAAEGLRRWAFLTVDYALGHALERDATAALLRNRGRVVAASRHPLNAADLASPLVAAQAAGAEVLALANTGADAINAVKQAREFGLTPGMRVAALFLQLSDVHALGLPVAEGLRLASPFYWDLDEGTRAFARRFAARMDGRMPTEDHAGVYSATRAYLDAVVSAGTVAGAAVVAAMRQAPIDDPLFGRVTIRADGRAVHDLHLFEVKAPSQSRGPYDYYRRLATIPGERAFRPLGEGGCGLR